MNTQDNKAAMTGGSKQATTLRSGRPKWRRIILVEEDRSGILILLGDFEAAERWHYKSISPGGISLQKSPMARGVLKVRSVEDGHLLKVRVIELSRWFDSGHA